MITTHPTSKIRLVVYKGHTLGFILPQSRSTMSVLKGSLLRGSHHLGMCNPIPVNPDDTESLRLASRADFEEFGVHAGGYFDNPDEYEFEGDPEEIPLPDCDICW